MRDSYMMRRIIHKDIDPEKTSTIYAIDDDERDAVKVLTLKKEPV